VRVPWMQISENRKATSLVSKPHAEGFPSQTLGNFAIVSLTGFAVWDGALS